jgi:K+-sensing histidine kinase KdpD
VSARTDAGASGIGEVVALAAAGSDDLEGLVRPVLKLLATVADLESTYLTVFDWARREQEVRFVHSAGEVEIEEGSRLPLPAAVSRESLPGVTRSRTAPPGSHPDSQAAKRRGLRTYVSVPVVLAKHELYGMVCGASRKPQSVSEPVVSVMEFLAHIVADHVTRARVAATERRADLAEEQLRTRARFLAVAEHQLKTPLTTLLGAAQALRDGWAGLGAGERDTFLDMVTRSAQDLSARVGGLLVEARADVRSRELAGVDLDLVDFVGMITRAFDALETDHEVRAEVEVGLRATADPAALHQVLGHLLDNAVKYSPARGIISVTGQTTPDGVAIAVVDEGVGLPAGMDVFDAFQRGDNEQVGVAPGIGLGLHIVRNLVEAMGGSVTAEENAGPGSTFTVRLPGPGEADGYRPGQDAA